MDEVTEKKEEVLDPATSQMKEQAEAAVENLGESTQNKLNHGSSLSAHYLKSSLLHRGQGWG